MKVSRRWIEWAHVAESESGPERYPESCKLMELAESRGRGAVEVNDAALLRELLAVAECYGPGSATDDMGPWWRGERNRVVKEARGIARNRKPRREPQLNSCYAPRISCYICII